MIIITSDGVVVDVEQMAGLAKSTMPGSISMPGTTAAARLKKL